MALSYPNKSSNPFGDDDEETGNFGQPRRGPNAYGAGGGGASTFNSAPRRSVPASSSAGSQMQAQIEGSQARTMESQQRALASIYASEQLGNATAEELLEQGEKLRRADRKLDEINDMQKTTQRQINSLSSVFGGMKNWFAKKPSLDQGATKTDIPKPASSEKLASTIRANSEVGSRAGGGIQQSQGPTAGGEDKSATPGANTAYQKQFDNNLDEMSAGMSRLKGLASGLNHELTEQNEQLTKMGTKMDKVHTTMRSQDRQLNTILYGSGGKK